jgi:hypothetical protein
MIRSSRALGALEILGVTGVAFTVTWVIGPRLEMPGLAAPTILLLSFAAAYVAYISPVLIHRDPPEARGLGRPPTGYLRTDNLVPALKSFGAVTLLGSGLILAAVLLARPAAFTQLDWSSLLLKLGLYCGSAAVQCLLFLGFFRLRLKDFLGLPQELAAAEPGVAVRQRLLLSAVLGVLFSLYHLPNLPVMGIALLLGTAMTWLYDVHPNLAAAALCHAALGTLLHRVAGLNMRIGLFYWQRDRWVFRTLFPWFKELIGDRF